MGIMKRKCVELICIIIIGLTMMNISYADIPDGVRDNYTYNKKDSSILIVKERLNELGYFGDGPVQFSDFVSEQLKSAVISFQKKNKVKADGVLDRDLLELLFSDEAIGKDGKKKPRKENEIESPLVANTAVSGSARTNERENILNSNNIKSGQKDNQYGNAPVLFIALIVFSVFLLIIVKRKRKAKRNDLTKPGPINDTSSTSMPIKKEEKEISKQGTANKKPTNTLSEVDTVKAKIKEKKEQELHQIRLTYDSFTIKSELMKTIRNSSDILDELGQCWIEAFATPMERFYPSSRLLYGSDVNMLFYKPRYSDLNLTGNEDIEECPPLKRLCSLARNILSYKSTDPKNYTIPIDLWGLVMNNDREMNTAFVSEEFKEHMVTLWGKINYLFESLKTYGLIAYDTKTSREAFYLLVYDTWYNKTLKHYHLDEFKNIRLSQTMDAEVLFHNLSGIDTSDFTKVWILAEKEYFIDDGQSYIFTDLLDKYQKCYKEYVEKAARKKYISDLLNKDQYVRYYSILDTDHISSYDFEKLIAELFRKRGYNASVTKQSGDQGVDIIAIKAGERIAIQAKCYPNSTVGNKAIQEVVAGMKLYNASSAVVVTNSAFTSSAIELAKANSVELIDRNKLEQLLLQYPISKN